MSFTIDTKKESSCKNHKFCIYHHELSMEDLDDYIIQIMFDKSKLHQLFEPNTTFESKKRLNQLRRFIETDFKNKEEKITDGDIEDRIKDNTNPSYFSFFAEALLARLNIDYIDNELATAVISVTETIKDGKTGADVCMFSDDNLVIGEAKFYGGLSGGLSAIIDDSSFTSKLDSYCTNIIAADCEIIIKGITGDVKEKSTEEIKKMPFTFTGFVLHTKNDRNNYDTHYEKIDGVIIDNMPGHFRIHLYHLPVKSKEELIFKVQRTALDLIVKLKSV
jgi:hypothetical protein